MTVLDIAATPAPWASLSTHRAYLLGQAQALLRLFKAGLNQAGGFHDLDAEGCPFPPGEPAGGVPALQIHVTTRMVHCYAIGHLLGLPGADRIVDHGMDFLWNGHRDSENGGYFWGVGYGGPTDDTKQAYGHAFVLLAASSAKVVGHPDADRLLSDIATVLQERFWEERYGAVAEEFTRDWKPFDTYRGQNSNMHLTEALMAAFEATGERTFLDKAERIADLIVRQHAAANGWRLAEHFDAEWKLDKAYSGSPVFRPYGTTPGHWLEWARLLLQLWALGGRKLDWLPGAAKSLFLKAVEDGWDKDKGGLYYTIDWDGSPRIRDRYWWPVTEAIGAAHFLNQTLGEAVFEDWYRRLWSFSDAHFIDHRNGGWFPQLGEDLHPNTGPFYGKPDIYHALQACLIPLLPATGSITKGLKERGAG